MSLSDGKESDGLHALGVGGTLRTDTITLLVGTALRLPSRHKTPCCGGIRRKVYSCQLKQTNTQNPERKNRTQHTLHRSCLGTEAEEREGFSPMLVTGFGNSETPRGDWSNSSPLRWALLSSPLSATQVATQLCSVTPSVSFSHPRLFNRTLMFKVSIVSSQRSCLRGRDFSISAESGVHLEDGWVPVQVWTGRSFHLYLLRAGEQQTVCVRPLHETRRNLSTEGAKWVENPKAVWQLS